MYSDRNGISIVWVEQQVLTPLKVVCVVPFYNKAHNPVQRTANRALAAQRQRKRGGLLVEVLNLVIPFANTKIRAALLARHGQRHCFSVHRQLCLALRTFYRIVIATHSIDVLSPASDLPV